MARIRTIKPEFWKHEELSALPEPTHMLAAALLNYADDEGYFNANPGLIKADCCPLRDPSVSIQDSLNLLAKIDFINLGSGPDGKRYGRLPTFDEHQRVNRPTASKIKALGIVWDNSPNPHGGLTEDSPPEGNREQGREQGTGKGNAPDGASGADAPSLTLVSKNEARGKTKPRGKSEALTFTAWNERARAEGRPAIPPDHAVYAYAAKVGLPDEFIALEWAWFSAKYEPTSERQAAWDLKFLNAVKGAWGNLWRLADNGYQLTTAGVQQQRELAARGRKDAA